MQILSNPNSFKGVFTAIVTPFTSDRSIDWKAYERLLQKQLEGNIHGVVTSGTTGESPTLSDDEKKRLLEFTLEKSKSKYFVIAGTGSNDTEKTIRDTKAAGACGAHAALVVTPYYNKPTQKGLEDHFLAVASESSIPIILYNVPGRTGISLQTQTILSLAKHPNIAGIKEASGNIGFLTEIKTGLSALKLKKHFTLLSGDDPTFWPFLACGGEGIISVASNIIPKCMRMMFEDWFEGRVGHGMALHDMLYSFFNLLFVEPNPVPIKTLLAHEKQLTLSMRRPLSEMTPENSQKLFKAWDSMLGHIRKDQPREDIK